jgi:hypothetical protein
MKKKTKDHELWEALSKSAGILIKPYVEEIFRERPLYTYLTSSRPRKSPQKSIRKDEFVK